jgi:uncharacterized membrane protein
MKFLLPYVVALAALGLLDALWLGLVTKNFVRAEIGHLFGDHIVWWAVVLFYLLYAGAVVYFAVAPGASIADVLMRGALLGFVAYMTYDLTNLATLQGWPVLFVLEDVAWGTVMTAFAAAVAYLVF